MIISEVIAFKLLLIIVAGLIGGIFGSFTGIVPGIHANTLAIMLLSTALAIEKYLDYYISDLVETRLVLAVIIASTSIAHTFANFIPGTFLGAPEGETALGILPMHQMVKAEKRQSIRPKPYTLNRITWLNNFHKRLFSLSSKEASGPFSYRTWFRWPSLFGPITSGRLTSEMGATTVQESRGRGYHAVYYSLIGSMFAVLFCFLIIVLISYNVTASLEFYEIMKNNMFEILLLVSFLMIVTERNNKKNAIGVFLIAGIFGYVILNDIEGKTSSPFGFPSTALFPTFTGLFGIATLIYARQNTPDLKIQKLDEPLVSETLENSFLGTISGSFVGLLPGVTPGIGTIFAMQLRGLVRKIKSAPVSILFWSLLTLRFSKVKNIVYTWLHYNDELDGPFDYEKRIKSDRIESVIVTLGAVNTAASLAILAALFIILRPRNGTTIVINELIDVEPWISEIPIPLLYLFMGVLMGSAVSFSISQKVGKLFPEYMINRRIYSGFSSNFKDDYVRMVDWIIVLLIVLVYVFTGVVGLGILTVATAIGYLPVSMKIRRTHAMGVLLLPVMIFFAPEWLIALLVPF